MTALEELVAVDLSEAEVRLLSAGLGEWGGPARCTEKLAVGMGFASVADLFSESDRLARALLEGAPLSRRDWTRCLLATEIVFASTVVGSGLDWQSTVGWADEETVILLREVQLKLGRSGVISLDAIMWALA